MNYYEYFLKCRQAYEQENKPSLEEFYLNPVVEVPINQFDKEYLISVDNLSKKVKKHFDLVNSIDIMLKHDDIWQ